MTQASEQRPCWFVGAAYGGRDPRTQQFIEQGIWATESRDTGANELVKQIRPGDRIAIKANFTQKNDLPFTANGQTVSAMRIKATGKVSEIVEEGISVKVDWNPVDEKKNWYLFTFRPAISKVYPNSPEAKALIDFTFEDKAQDFDFFLSLPRWKERFNPVPERFLWTSFYMEFATGLLRFKEDRAPLLEKIRELSATFPLAAYVKDVFADGIGPLDDICPFTVMGTFNRNLTDANRIAIASHLASFLGISTPTPEQFNGIPVLNNIRCRFFRYAKERSSGDIPALWRFFEAALHLAALEGEGTDENYESARTEFVEAYTTVSSQTMVSWNLTIGLYWVRPWTYPTLDTLSRRFIPSQFTSLAIPKSLKGAKAGQLYLKIKDSLESAFNQQTAITSFPALSLAAWENSGLAPTGQTDEDIAEPETAQSLLLGFEEAEPPAPYTITSILQEDCFLDEKTLTEMLDRLKIKKNIILQGPPGTGKTWLAKRLAQALIGCENSDRIRSLQFHGTLSYEDFVRGWRPVGKGQLELCDGPFLELIETAAMSENREKPFVMVIEEINRGNPAQIFGELLTLLEADKRSKEHGLILCYQGEKKEGEERARLFIPPNVYLIGTMNIADRSLALVDFALRRRFAFFTLQPALNDTWERWIQDKRHVPPDVAHVIRKKIGKLNATIENDSTLGPQYTIGHSYVSPDEPVTDALRWFKGVIHSEIVPLLREYWFDNKKTLSTTVKELEKDL